MTTAAHNGRRVWGGATHRTHDGRTGARRDLYRELHPEMFADIPSSKPVKPPPPPKPKRPQAAPKVEAPKPTRPKLDVAPIIDFLRNGDATISEIAVATGIDADHIRIRLWRGIKGIERRVEMAVPERGAPRPLYGLAKDNADA